MVDGGGGAGFKAFVEASAGAAGALFSTVCLYPIDLAKTRIQAGYENSAGINKNIGISGTLLAIYKDKGVKGLFTGLDSKAISTVASGFAYFYLYSFILSSYVRKYGKLSVGSNLSVATLAAALNMGTIFCVSHLRQ